MGKGSFFKRSEMVERVRFRFGSEEPGERGGGSISSGTE